MAGASHVNLAAVILAALGVLGLVVSGVMFVLWLSDPADMFKENNPMTMAIYALVGAASGASLYFGLRYLRR